MTESLPKVWIALFSQSGSELVSICKKLGRFPDAVLTNNLKADFSESPFEENGVLRVFDTKSLFNVMREIHEFYNGSREIVVTLHGFLRILPEDICNIF